jgi:tetratricopeptide (TPR) repeat protein
LFYINCQWQNIFGVTQPPGKSIVREPEAPVVGWPIYVAAGTIVVAALAAYHNSFSGPFIFDDRPAIADNPTIRHFWPIRPVLSPPHVTGSTVNGRPLLNLSLAVNYAISSTGVWSYHALNLAIHILAGLTLFGIVRRTLGWMASRPSARRSLGAGGPFPLGVAITLLWVLHPLQTESVTYIVQRAESLMGLFYLLTLYCFTRYAENRPSYVKATENEEAGGRGWAMLSIICCLLGMATKEVMVSAPLMVWLFDRTFVSGTFRKAWRRHWGLYLGLASTWLLLGYLAIGTGGRGHTVGFGAGVAWPAYALTQFGAVAHYLRLSFWPHPLVFDYGTAVVSRLGDVAPQLAIVALLLAVTLVALWRWPALGFCGAWFFAVLAPTSSIVPVATQTTAEHRMYLPLAAVVALVVLVIYAVAGRRSFPLFLAMAVGLGFLTARRNEDYRSAVSIWSDTVAQYPESSRAHNNLANALAENPGRLSEAVAHYEEALRLKPDNAEAHYNLANALATIPSRLPEAITHFEEALRLKPDYAEAHNNLAIALATIPSRLPEAIAHYEQALRLKPDYAEVHNDLAVALAKIPGRLPEAIAHYEQALRLKPDYAEAHSNLAIALAKVPGRLPEAIAHYEQALRLKPDYAEAHFNLANALAKIPGRLPEAITRFEEALRLKPNYAEAHNDLAVALAKIPGRLPEAITHFEEALRLKPDYAEAHNNLAIALTKIPGRLSEAIAHYEQALGLKPDDAEAHFNLANALAKIPGRLPEAIAHYEQALRLEPDYVEAHNNLAVAYANTGRLDEAIRQLEMALRFNPDFSDARRNLERLKALGGASN